MREEKMFPIITSFLISNGYRIIEIHSGHERGPDIVAHKSGRELIIEVKGDTAALAVDLGTAMWQLLRYMKDDSKDFGLALSMKYLPYIKAVDYPLRRLNIKVFVVSPTGLEQLY